ncbi:hypothetical protein [Clostridium sp.]|uniref:hypothetical protein n=1 Tax=Clostridium sp. TaxID=1506 RepID=UPI003D6CD1D8
MKILKVLKLIIIGLVSLISILILTLGVWVLITTIQTKLFLPKEYIIWTFKYPFSVLVFIYEFYIIFGFFCFLNKSFRKFIINFNKRFIKKNRKSFLASLIILNIILIYTILFNVTVITNNKIIDYTFLSPQGNQYSFNDIVKIDTGVYGKKTHFPYSHYTKGDFYYILLLNDDNKIHLTDGGRTKNDEDEHFIIEKLDIQYVNMGIPKVSNIENFEFCTEGLAKRYTDKIRNILLNIK